MLLCFTQQLILLNQDLEPLVHGRARKESMDEMYFGVYDQLLYARKIQPVEGNPPFSTSYPSPNDNCFAMYKAVSHVVLLTYVLPLFLTSGAQWTGIVTAIAVEMLKANMVDAVVCVQRHPTENQIPHHCFLPQCTRTKTCV
jgi:7-hydroxymethyl chlorophyll a reductase